MQKRLYCSILIFCIMSVGLLTSCTASINETESNYYIYYKNRQSDKILKQVYEPEATEQQEIIEELIVKMNESASSLELEKIKPNEVEILNWIVKENQLYVNYSETYLELKNVTEVFLRMATVRTLIRVPGIEYVAIQVEGEPLLDTLGEPIGLMTENNFIENTGGGINSYKYASLVLYFANETGDKLVKEKINVHYSTNKSLEQLVVEQVINGPQGKDAYPTVDSTVKIVNATVKDGVCYVSLDSVFLEPKYNLKASLPVYSIVNSLIDTCKVNRVQISINGQTDLTYMEEIRFDTFFERNVEIIEVLVPLETEMETVVEGMNESS